MSTNRLHLRLLILLCLAVAVVNGLKWYLAIPTQPTLTHFSGTPTGLQETHVPGQAWVFRLTGVDGDFYIADMVLAYGRVRRELDRGEIIHIWVNEAEFRRTQKHGRARAEVWRITRDDHAVISERDVFAAAHEGRVWRIVLVVLAFAIATAARVKLFVMRRNQRFDRMRRPAKPTLKSGPAATKPVSGRATLRN